MSPNNDFPLQVRDAGEADVPALTLIKGTGTESVHRDRLRTAQAPGFRYLVLLAGKDLVGIACLVTRRPAHSSDADDTEHLPQIVDLQIGQAHRRRGYGTAFIQAVGFRPVFGF
jgi:hypothetical protein